MDARSSGGARGGGRTDRTSRFALFGRATVPFGVWIMRAAEPLPAVFAVLLRGFFAGFVYAGNTLTSLFLGLDGGYRHGFLRGASCCWEGTISGQVPQHPLCLHHCKQYTPVRRRLQPYCG